MMGCRDALRMLTRVRRRTRRERRNAHVSRMPLEQYLELCDKHRDAVDAAEARWFQCERFRARRDERGSDWYILP